MLMDQREKQRSAGTQGPYSDQRPSCSPSFPDGGWYVNSVLTPTQMAPERRQGKGTGNQNVHWADMKFWIMFKLDCD